MATQETVDLGLSQQNIDQTAALLNRLVANETVLYQRLRNYHWNVTGPAFHSLHEMFEEQYNAVAERIDELAERVRALGHKAVGTLEELVKLATLKEKPGDYPKWEEMVAQLVADHEQIVQNIRRELSGDFEASYGDVGTEDLITSIMESHEKEAWMLRSILS